VFAGAHTCALTITGAAYCWGFNGHGELGDGDTAVVTSTPAAVADGLAFQTLSVSKVDGVTCGLTAAGAAYWGSAHRASWEAVMHTTPVAVAGGRTFLGLAAGGRSTCGVTNELATYCWALNSFGTLGDGTLSRRLAPVPVAGGATFQSISAGFATMCGVTAAGTGHCWGYNFGALGDGTAEHRSAPVAVAGGLGFRHISAGTGYSCGVTTAGVVYCWGDNSNGQLADGTIVASERPVRVFLALTAEAGSHPGP
jgi:alpha-tubulin suppressor-like RCC1 family protein